MTINDLVELVFGTGLFFISLVGAIIVTNKITQFIIDKVGLQQQLNILSLIVHLCIIVAFVYFIRNLFYKYVKNKNLVNSIFTLTGPIIGLTSLYMSDTLHALVKSI